MPRQLVECIPNFSEGRRPEVIAAIKDSISQVKGISLLDQHSDEDHNRTVLTFSGAPDAVVEAAFAGIAKAAELINLDHHKGEHPRIGATDVVPFVPLAGISMKECVELAHNLGQKVGDELGIPVYLYEAAATRTDRRNLESIRRGEYEGLKESIQSDPAKEPDFGPKQLGRAGATVIGARPPLIAFNVYLKSDDVEIAKKIAKSVRHSSGGLRYVKALGLLVEGRAQVSMNLTNFRQTSIATVVEHIRTAAERYGTQVHSSELVGLIPQEALADAAQWYLQMDEFNYDQVLETRLYAGGDQEQIETDSFLDKLAAGSATPGGGSAAAFAGAMAASLVEMVAKLSMGKEKYREIEPRMKEIELEAQKLRERLDKAVDEDALAYEGVMNAFRMPRDSEGEQELRTESITSAISQAATVPLFVAAMALRTMELAFEIARDGNFNAISDAGTSGAMASAAVKSASMNVRINAKSSPDGERAKAWLEEVDVLEKKAELLAKAIERILQERAGI